FSSETSSATAVRCLRSRVAQRSQDKQQDFSSLAETFHICKKAASDNSFNDCNFKMPWPPFPEDLGKESAKALVPKEMLRARLTGCFENVNNNLSEVPPEKAVKL